ncbi:hypothetical protein [Pseudomonas sp. AOB-7]|uniref:hypothetical protein n=1 Tax=Pseudomonas sp. AOB-7 TaxID=2482750 RepID=UPI0011C3E736|nr:hypothetical protein [Pseudomonas sp. AOB-7]
MLMKVSITRLTAVFLASLIATLVQGTANGAVSLGAFGDPHHAVPPVSSEQSPVVHYRPGLPGEPLGAASNYVQGGFHIGLLPGGYNVFCLASGERGINPAPRGTPTYAGKHARPKLQFEGRKTQFLRASTYVHQVAQIVERKLAEEELAEHRLQAHVLSRAAAGLRDCATSAGKDLLAIQ